MALKIDYTLRLPDGQFFPAARKKTGIAIHHTVGGTAGSTVAYWLKDRTRSGKLRLVGTAYIIDRDGTVCQVFPPTAWAFQFGLKWPAAQQMKFEQRFIGHSMVRSDKTDPAPNTSFWDRLTAECRLTRMPNPPASQSDTPVLTDDELQRLYASNVEQIIALSVAAGSVVNGLIMELERRDTYIRLYYAERDGHRVEYEFLSGDEELVKRLAAALGIECLGESVLQVSHG